MSEYTTAQLIGFSQTFGSKSGRKAVTEELRNRAAKGDVAAQRWFRI